MIEYLQVSHRYGNSEWSALDRIALTVPQGSLVLVAGPSGGGKSTLLRAGNGLVPHFHGGRFKGTVLVDGASTLEVRPRDLASKVGFVSQDPDGQAVVDQVEDDILFTLQNLGADATSMRKRLEEVLDALGIANLRKRRLTTLSGGERQRCAIASAMVAMPNYLILDEPTSQLDPQSAEEVIAAVLRLRDEMGVSILMAEHRLDRVLQYADQMAILEQGRLRSGPPRELIRDCGFGPPIVRLALALGRGPVPLNLREARELFRSLVPKPAARGKLTRGDRCLYAHELEIKLGGTTALRGVDLEVHEGEVVVVMGRTGSGKTTLLRSLAGLEAPARGTRGCSGPVTLVPQNPQRLLFRPTVADEIAETLRARSLPWDEAAVSAEAERFEISRLADRYPRELSGGEQTMAAIAAAAAGEPKVILMDEPTRGLDEAKKSWLAAQIGRWSAGGKAILIATHDVELAARVAHRVVLLGEGELILDAPPTEALAKSLTFSTQINKVFGDQTLLTVEDVLAEAGAAL